MANQNEKMKFSDLPEKVQNWLSSPESALLVAELNRRLGQKGVRQAIIPRTIYKLVTKELSPASFINEISEGLKINFQTAKTVSEDIVTKILSPVEGELRKYVDIDIRAIRFGEPRQKTAEFQTPPLAEPGVEPETAEVATAEPSSEEPAPLSAIPTVEEKPTPPPAPPTPKPVPPTDKIEEPSEAPKPMEEVAGLSKGPRVDLESFEKTKAYPSPPRVPAPPPPEPREVPGPKRAEAGAAPLPEAASPFYLHQEKSIFTPPTKEQLSARRPSLNIKVKNYSQAEEEKKKGIPVRLEAPDDQPTTDNSQPIITKITAPPMPKAKDEPKQERPRTTLPAKAPSPPAPAKPVSREKAPEYLSARPKAPSQPPTEEQKKKRSKLVVELDKKPTNNRIVHYNGNRTPVNNLGIPKKEVSDDNVVDLRKLR